MTKGIQHKQPVNKHKIRHQVAACVPYPLVTYEPVFIRHTGQKAPPPKLGGDGAVAVAAFALLTTIIFEGVEGCCCCCCTCCCGGYTLYETGGFTGG